ncbi:uncharacterized protein AB9W97_018696 isoform 2-T3 [Spinachia spinachia]
MESPLEVSQVGGPKPSVAPKPRLTPKPFSLQKNTTIRSINAPKAAGVTSRTTTQGTDKSQAKPPASPPAQKPPQQTLASDSQPGSKTAGDGEDTPDTDVGKSAPFTQTAPPKETPRPESICRDDVNQANRRASSDIVNTPQTDGKKKEDEAPTSAVQNMPDSGNNASSADITENQWGGSRKRLSMKLTSKFESLAVSLPPQPAMPATSTKEDGNKPEVPDPEPGHPTSKPPDREMNEGGLKEEYSGGGSIKRRISLLFDSSSRPEPMTKRDEPEVVNSTAGVKGVKERMKIWAVETTPGNPKADKPPLVAPRNHSKRLQSATAPTAVKTPEIPTVKPPVMGTLSGQAVDLPSKVSPAEPPPDLPMETNKDAATEDKLSKSWRVEHVQNPSTEADVQLRKRSSFKTRTAADEGDSAEGESAQHAPKRDIVKRRSVRFSVVERDDGGPPVFLGSASESSDEEGEASENKAEEEIPVSLRVYRRLGGLQRKDDDDDDVDDDDKEEERLKHLEFEKKRRSEEHDQPQLKMEDELKRKEEERKKEKARQNKVEERKQDSLEEELIERQKREEWEREHLLEDERRQEEMEREKQLEMLLQRQREEERERAKQKEQRLKHDQEESEKERLKEAERKEERLRQEREREKQKFRKEAINEEKKREDEWEKEWVKQTKRLRGAEEKGGENEFELMEQRQKEERLSKEREKQRGREEKIVIGNHADYQLEGKLRETEINKKKQREEEWEKEWVKKTERLRGGDEEKEVMLQRKTEEDRETARQNEGRLRQKEREQRRLEAQMQSEAEERKRQVEREREEEMERMRQIERQRQREEEEERKRQIEREREEEMERMRQIERQREEEEERKRQAERERVEELERVRQEAAREREQDLEEKLRLEEERQREEIESASEKAESNLIRLDSKDVPHMSEFPNSPAAKSYQPTEGHLKVVYDDFSVRPPLAQVVFDDFSVKPKRWGSQAEVETSPLSHRRSAVFADKEEVQVPLNVTNTVLEQVEKTGTPEPTLIRENPRKEEEKLISLEEDEEEDKVEEEDEEVGEEEVTQGEDEEDESESWAF